MPSKIEKGKILANLSTFKIGGSAKYFVKARNEKEIIEVIRWTKNKKIPFFILGGGSNVLFSDKGFNGLVIKLQNTKYEIRNTKIIAEAGCPLQKLVQESVKNGLAGLEWAVGIPGTIGGAIYGNAGAFGQEMKDVVEKVKVLKIANCKFEILNLNKKKCKFSYRDSIFKRKKDLIILEATLKLKKENKKELQKKIREILKIRKEKQPLEFPSIGSIFKNVPLEKVPKKIQEKFKDKIRNGFLPAGVLIESVGLKGKVVGGARISEKHANFIVNFSHAKAKDVSALIKLIKRKIKGKFKIELEEEIILVGF